MERVENDRVFSLLNKVKGLREQFLPKELSVGNCIDICIVLGRKLQLDGHVVNLVHGMYLDCLHTWLEIDGVSIDAGRDCVGIVNNRPFVAITSSNTHSVMETIAFDLENFFSNESAIEDMIKYLNK